MFSVKLGQPRNKQLLRMMEDPEKRKAMDKAELSLYPDTRKKELFAQKEELFFAIDEKAHEADLTEKGRNFLSPDDPDAFVLPGFDQRISRDRSRTAPRRAEGRKKAERQEHFDKQAEQIHAISQLLKAYCLYEKDVAVRRPGQQGHHRGREHRPLDDGPPLERRLAPGGRSQGRRRDRARNANARDDHDSELFPPLPQARRHDRHRGNRSLRVLRHLQARRAVIPTNRPVARKDANDSVYKTRREKFNAVLKEIQRASTRRAGRSWSAPSPSKSASMLPACCKRGNHSPLVLNAKFHQQEAEIVARAGQRGAVTIATNMAGRGTDIKLGPGVPEVGGLHVIGTERHEARRIDRQLRGRCARQGDPGSSHFFISLRRRSDAPVRLGRS